MYIQVAPSSASPISSIGVLSVILKRNFLKPKMKNISTTSGVNNSASSNALNVSFQIQDIAACSLVVLKAVSIVAGNSLLIILLIWIEEEASQEKFVSYHKYGARGCVVRGCDFSFDDFLTDLPDVKYFCLRVLLSFLSGLVNFCCFCIL